MSTLVTKNLQIGADGTASNNFTVYQPVSPDGTLRIGNGNSGTTSAQVVLTSAGNVGIGTSSPTYRLTVRPPDNNGVLISSGNDSHTGFLFFGDTTSDVAGAVSYDHSNNAMRFQTANTERMRIDSSGNLLVGTTTPANSARLTVATGSSRMGFSSYSGTNNTAINTIAVNTGDGGGLIVITGASFNSGQSFCRLFIAGIKVSSGATSVVSSVVSSVGEGGVSFAFSESGGFLRVTPSGLPLGAYTVMFMNA